MTYSGRENCLRKQSVSILRQILGLEKKLFKAPILACQPDAAYTSIFPVKDRHQVGSSSLCKAQNTHVSVTFRMCLSFLSMEYLEDSVRDREDVQYTLSIFPQISS